MPTIPPTVSSRVRAPRTTIPPTPTPWVSGGLVHERLDEAELLPVAGGELVHGSIEVSPEPIDQRVASPQIDSAPELRQGETVADRLRAGTRVRRRPGRAETHRPVRRYADHPLAETGRSDPEGGIEPIQVDHGQKRGELN